MNGKTFAQEELDYFSGLEGNPSEQLSYSAPYRQQARFQSVIRALQPIGLESILDVGCGYGDFLPVIKANNPDTLSRYRGIDIVPKFVNEAEKIHSSMTGMDDISWGTESIFQTKGTYDAVIAIGMFTKKTDGFQALQLETVKRMWKMANKAVCFTTFSTLTHDMPSENQPTPIQYLMDIVIKLGSEKFELTRYDPAYVQVLTVYK